MNFLFSVGSKITNAFDDDDKNIRTSLAHRKYNSDPVFGDIWNFNDCLLVCQHRHDDRKATASTRTGRNTEARQRRHQNTTGLWTIYIHQNFTLGY